MRVTCYCRIGHTLYIVDGAHVAETCAEDVVTKVTTSDVDIGMTTVGVVMRVLCYRTVRTAAIYTVPQPRIVGRSLVVLYGNLCITIHLAKTSVVNTLRSYTSRTACEYLLIYATALDEHCRGCCRCVFIFHVIGILNVGNITTAIYLTEDDRA